MGAAPGHWEENYDDILHSEIDKTNDICDDLSMECIEGRIFKVHQS